MKTAKAIEAQTEAEFEVSERKRFETEMRDNAVGEGHIHVPCDCGFCKLQVLKSFCATRECDYNGLFVAS